MKEVTELTSIEMVDSFIENHPLSFIYISRTNCGVCTALLPKVREMLGEYPQIKLGYINADHLEEVAGRFSIFTVPVLLFFADGREMVREARYVHLNVLQEKIDRIYQLMDVEQ